MPVDLPAAIETAIQHLRDGALQAADTLLTDTLNDYRAGLKNIGLGPPLMPRGKFELCVEFMKRAAAKFGNPRDLEELLIELDRAE